MKDGRKYTKMDGLGRGFGNVVWADGREETMKGRGRWMGIGFGDGLGRAVKGKYDAALFTNTLGAKHVLDFAKKCARPDIVVHVSTAYVCGEKCGLVEEKPFRVGETLNGSPDLDIKQEIDLANETLEQLRCRKATNEDEKVAMKELGLTRARMYGWPNTYVFTKALGEMLIEDNKENIPVAIIRPTIITSTYKEPFPGWVDGIRTIDHMFIGYGKGKVRCFLGNSECTLDLIPGDMVVNTIIMAMVANANQLSQAIYHVGSSMRNPLNPLKLKQYGHSYFSNHPWIGRDGKAVRVREPIVFTKMDSFYRYMNIRYVLPFKTAVRGGGGKRDTPAMDDGDVAFDDLNTEKLRAVAREVGAGADAFNFDTKCIGGRTTS
ncbi:hypothetical protein Scep_015531 [Stephania cephalantha]|uniref:Fatty acyl-CoA reductase n=1 Tax=Stephania cephalantha TaxID=152367 RepID=A0AAP0P2W7_9MAGN